MFSLLSKLWEQATQPQPTERLLPRRKLRRVQQEKLKCAIKRRLCLEHKYDDAYMLLRDVQIGDGWAAYLASERRIMNYTRGTSRFGRVGNSKDTRNWYIGVRQ